MIKTLIESVKLSWAFACLNSFMQRECVNIDFKVQNISDTQTFQTIWQVVCEFPFKSIPKIKRETKEYFSNIYSNQHGDDCKDGKRR